MPDLYETLGVPPNADSETIKRAYRKKRSSSHPDHAGDKEAFHAVTVAYETLSDPGKRKKYDQTGETAGPDNSASKVMGDVAQLLMQVLASLDPDTTDYVDAMRQSIIHAQQQRRTKIAELQQGIVRREKALKRFKRKKKSKGPDMLTAILEGNIRELQRGIASLEAEIEHGGKMIAVIADYEYAFDKPMPAGGFGVHAMAEALGAGTRFTGFRRF